MESKIFKFKILSLFFVFTLVLFAVSCSYNKEKINTKGELAEQSVKNLTETKQAPLQEAPKNNEVIFEIGKVDYVLNKEVIVPVTLHNSEKYSPNVFQLDISYDPNTVKIASVLTGDSVTKSGKDMNWNRPDDKSIKIVAFGSNNKNIIQDGEIVKLKIVPLTNEPNFKIVKSLVKNPQGVLINSSIR